MTARKSRKFLTLSLALCALGSGWAVRDSRADPINYGTVGYVDTPANTTPGLITFTGTTGTVSGPQSINLGQFTVSSAALMGTPVDFTGDQFYIITHAGANQSELITGTLSGSVGLGVTTPLTETITSVTPFSATSMPLPFSLQLPIGVAQTLNTTPGAGGASTTVFTAAAAPVPEPASVAVFAVALGTLAFWRRRSAR
jgi:PEP-CTERM motif